MVTHPSPAPLRYWIQKKFSLRFKGPVLQAVCESGLYCERVRPSDLMLPSPISFFCGCHRNRKWKKVSTVGSQDRNKRLRKKIWSENKFGVELGSNSPRIRGLPPDNSHTAMIVCLFVTIICHRHPGLSDLKGAGDSFFELMLGP